MTTIERQQKHADNVQRQVEAQAKKPVKWFYFHASQMAQQRVATLAWRKERR